MQLKSRTGKNAKQTKAKVPLELDAVLYLSLLLSFGLESKLSSGSVLFSLDEVKCFKVVVGISVAVSVVTTVFHLGYV